MQAITNMGEEQLDACAQLYAAVFSSEPWNAPWTETNARDRLQEILDTPGFLGLIVEGEGQLLGFVMGCLMRAVRGRIFYLHEMCVAVEAQRGGLGSALLDRLHERLVREDVSKVFLLTMKGSPAEAFYLKNAYREEHSGVMLTKDLG